MFKITRVHVYHTLVSDVPGGTAAELKKLAEAGIHLEYVHSERSTTNPGMGDLYIAPRQVKAEIDHCLASGFTDVKEPIVMRFEGHDHRGLGGRLTMEWEKAGINLHGLMMTVVDEKFVGYAQFDHVEDANNAAHILVEMVTIEEPLAVK